VAVEREGRVRETDVRAGRLMLPDIETTVRRKRRSIGLLRKA